MQAALQRAGARWYWFALSVAAAYGLAKLYVRYTQPIYYTEARMLLREDAEDRKLLESLTNSFSATAGTRNLINEMAILHSSAMVREAADSLNLQTSVVVEGNIRATDFYKRGPLRVTTNKVATPLAGRQIQFEKTGPYQYRLFLNDKALVYHPAHRGFVEKANPLPPPLVFDQTYGLDEGDFACHWTPYLAKDLPREGRVFIVFNDLDLVADGLKASMNMAPLADKATVIVLSSAGPVAEKAVDFVNQLIRNYVRQGLMEKNARASATIQFIDDQLSDISTRLKKAEGDLRTFRAEKRVMDLPASSSASFARLAALEERKAELLVQRKYYDYLLGYVKRGGPQQGAIGAPLVGAGGTMVAPSSIGINDPLLTTLIQRLSTLYADRSSLSFSAKQTNPALGVLEDRIAVARKELEENVRNIIRSSDITMAETDRRIAEAESEINRLPDTERALVNIQRRFNLSDNIYTYLMQKRAEAGMAQAANTTDARLLEPATMRGTLQIAPKPFSIYALALVLGLMIPALVLAGSELLNTRIRSRAELERLTPIPVLGLVGHASTGGALVVSRSLKSLITEAFRTLRLNLTYLAPDRTVQLVGITSSVSGEGKTFTAINLAAVGALAGRRTLLILADMRKPKLDPDLGLDASRGLSSYLARQITLEQAVQPTSVAGLDAIASGPIPPNPAELLGTPAMAEMLTELRRRYDFIVLDTPPLGLVSDFQQLADLTDINLYLVRHNYTLRHFLVRINEAYREGRVRHLGLVINDVTDKGTRYGYGYAYGYGYGYGGNYFDDQKKKPWWRRIR